MTDLIIKFIGIVCLTTIIVTPVFFIRGLIQLVMAKEDDAKKKNAIKKIAWSAGLFVVAITLTFFAAAAVSFSINSHLRIL